jgi:hypothetical protein
MDVQGQLDTEGRHIAMSKRDGKISQQWDIVYVDDWQGEPGKGELNSDLGFYVQRPFYIVSALGEHRHLDEINNHNAVIKTRSNRVHQQWWFDQATLTIKSKRTNYSFNIQSNGAGNKLEYRGTNSNWW